MSPALFQVGKNVLFKNHGQVVCPQSGEAVFVWSQNQTIELFQVYKLNLNKRLQLKKEKAKTLSLLSELVRTGTGTWVC